MSNPKTILISRNLKENSALRSWCDQYQHTLIEVPFIRIDPVKNLDIPSTDWVFFSSPNGLDIYFEHYPLLAQKIGVFGKGTAARLKALNIRADFVGDTRKNPISIGHDFFSQLHPNESVLFPQSQLSKKSIVNANKTNICHQRVIYQTSLEQQEVPRVDYAILTSPSNIDGFLLENNPGGTQFLVLGYTSKKHFDSLNATDKIYQAESATEESVIDLLGSLMAKRPPA